jgi:hypothetical protein
MSAAQREAVVSSATEEQQAPVKAIHRVNSADDNSAAPAVGRQRDVTAGITVTLAAGSTAQPLQAREPLSHAGVAESMQTNPSRLSLVLCDNEFHTSQSEYCNTSADCCRTPADN